MEYSIDQKELDYSNGLIQNRYKSFFNVLDNTIKSAGRKENIPVSELSDLVNKYGRLFGAVVENVESKFKTDSLLNIVASKDNFLVAYSSYIGAKVIAQDLESALDDNSQTTPQNLERQAPFDKKVLRWGDISYTTISTALEGMVNYCLSSKKQPIESMRDYFTNLANLANSQIKSMITKEAYNHIKDVSWKIGPHKIDGLKKIILAKNGNSEKRIEEREKNQFYTPFQDLPLENILPRNRIVGDQNIITSLERMVKCLFMYNSAVGKNPMEEKRKFQQKIFLEGLPGGGKGEVCKYLVNFAKELNTKVKSDLKVTYFEFESSFVDGSIQKLKSQFRQIGEGNGIYLIFQDEIDQIFMEKGKGKDNSNNDVIKEFQKFLDGQYINKGNYLILAATNEYLKVPPALRQRFYTVHWKGAETKEEKARLLQYKLEQGIYAGYVKINDKEFSELGEMAYKFNLSGRDLFNVCKKLEEAAFKWEGVGEIFKLKGDYAAQLSRIDELNEEVGFAHVKKEIISLMNNESNAEKDSKAYEAS